MSDTAIKRPAIPASSGVVDWASLRLFLEPVKTLLEIHEGWIGRAGVDRFVPEGELSGMIDQVGNLDISTFVGNDTQGPGPPTDMWVTPGPFWNEITWVNPTDDDLREIEIRVNTVDSVTESDWVAYVTVTNLQGLAGSYKHTPSDLSQDHYYWIRAKDWSGNYSTWVPSEELGGFLAPGVETWGETIDALLAILAEQITETQLYADLNTRLDKIETTESAVTQNTADIGDGIDGLWASISSKVQVTTYETDITGEGGLMDRTAIAEEKLWVGTGGSGTPEDPADDTLLAQWTVKMDVNGHIAGVGLALDESGFSSFIIVADQFAVANPSNGWAPGKIPFVVGTVNGETQVGITGSLLVDESVTAVKICTEELLVGDNIQVAEGAITIAGLAEEVSGWVTGLAEDATAADIANLPATPTGSGLFCSAAYLGYYDSPDWKVYIGAGGTFKFMGDADNIIQWNGAAFSMATTGNIYMKGGTMSLTASAAINITAGSLNVSSSGQITVTTPVGILVQGGGDITIKGADSNPGKLIIKDGDGIYYTQLYATYSGLGLFWVPSAGSELVFNVGLETTTFASIRLYGDVVKLGDGSDEVFWSNGALCPGAADNTLGNTTYDAWYRLYMGNYIAFEGNGDPSALASHALLYGYTDSNVELRAMDSAGNTHTITPHHFSLFTPDPSQESPWSYYSKNVFLGKEINVDMYGAFAALEQLTGKKFIYTADVPREDWNAHQDAAEAARQAEIDAWNAAGEKERERLGDRPKPHVRAEMPAWMAAAPAYQDQQKHT